MLGKTAGGLFWMQRYLERSENISRLIDAGFRIALTRSEAARDEWASVLTTAGVKAGYEALYEDIDGRGVINYLLRDTRNPTSVLSMLDLARSNARLVRTALTREVWEAINEAWMEVRDMMASEIDDRDLPHVLSAIRRQIALVRGAEIGTMLRNDIYHFVNLGTFIERADATARILDVKYYVLLPSIAHVGSALDNVQWETILRSVSAHRSYRWVNQGEASASGIAEFLICDPTMPRSLAFCLSRIREALAALADYYDDRRESHELIDAMARDFYGRPIDWIMDNGLHEFIQNFIGCNNALAMQIETDYRFYG